MLCPWNRISCWAICMGKKLGEKCGLETTNDWGKEELRELAELLKLIIKQ